MLHNTPSALDRTFVSERKFEDVLKETYRRLDGLESQLRKLVTEAVERFAKDPADAIEWCAESVVQNQTELSIVAEIRTLINHTDTLEELPERFEAFSVRYQNQIIGWAQYGENCSSQMTNIASRLTLAATAKVFTDSFGLRRELTNAIASDIEETKKRIVVVEFASLPVNDYFYTVPDPSSLMFRKMSPRKAVECVYPITKDTPTRTFDKRSSVYLFRVPTESDVLYEESLAA